MTYQNSWWKNCSKWNAITKLNSESIIIYNGSEEMNFSDGRRLLNFNSIPSILEF